MQNFSRIRNKLIDRLEQVAIEPKVEQPLKNTLKTLVKNNISKTVTSNIYASKMAFDIPRAFDDLAQVYAKVTLSNDTTADVPESYFATKIFKSVIIRTKKGTQLQKITPDYTQMRLDEVYGTPLFSHMSLGLEPDIAFADGSPSVVLPLFFFFSENISSFLKTRKLEQLEIEFIVNDNYSAMGMTTSLTSLSVELFNLYHDTNQSNKFDDQILTRKNMPREIYSFNCFYEDTLTCATGTAKARLLLRCPYPLYVLHLNLVNANSNRALIKTVTLSTGGNTLIEFDHRMNYQTYGQSKGFLENGTVSIYFNKTKDRSGDSGLISFSSVMFPVYLDITFDTLASDYTLTAFEEYRNRFDVSENGDILLADNYTLDQSNSSTARAFLTG